MTYCNIKILKMKNRPTTLQTLDFDKVYSDRSLENSTQHLGNSIISRKSSTDNLFKVVLLGDSKVGKSSIVMRLVVRLKKTDQYTG